MLVTKKAESLVWIVIWMFILSFVLLWIGSMIWSSNSLILEFNREVNLDFLTSSSNIIIDNLDVSSFSDGDIFYVHKDTYSNSYDVYTWILNSEYKYIDKHWNKVDDISDFSWDVYTRIFHTTKTSYNWEEKVFIKPVIERVIN